MEEYETVGIETIARGVCIRGGRLLTCKAKGAKTCYLPGGHIEFGETGREALAREMKEETGQEARAGKFIGVVENKFMQHGLPHAEINLVYKMDFGAEESENEPGNIHVASKEDWIEFEWVALDRLDDAGLLPETFRRLGENPETTFEA